MPNTWPGLFGVIQNPDYSQQIETDGICSSFHTGKIYRYPGIVPMLEVRGEHYEMGLQYGVLLRPELMEAAQSYNKILGWTADQMKLPADQLCQMIKEQAKHISEQLPQRYLRELEGVAEGSGIAYDGLLAASLFYDVLMSAACTGLLMAGKDGTIIHARNNDTSGFGGEELGKMTVVVKHIADGYNTVTHMDYPFFMGVETGYNDKGITFSEETLHVKQPNPDGFSLTYLIRMIMEECDNLDQLPAYFDRYAVVGAYGTVWSDRQAGKGMVAELTPWGWSPIEMQSSILWNFNHIYSAKLHPQQAANANLHPSLDREKNALAMPVKEIYEVEDALRFIQLQVTAEGEDYTQMGTRMPICNQAASQAMIFDPQSLDFYMGVGSYYAARQNIYRFFDDFARNPELFMAATPMPAVTTELANIFNRLIPEEAARDEYASLARKCKDSAQAHFMTAYHAFRTHSLHQYAGFAGQAYALQPHVDEYRLYAGLAAYKCSETQKAIELLDGIQFEEVDRRQEPLRLYALKKCWENRDIPRAEGYARQLADLLHQYDAVEYFNASTKIYVGE